MENKDARLYSGWYKSYMDSDQGIALIECLEVKISQLEEIINTIRGESELKGEVNSDLLLDSINTLSTNIEPVSATKGYFKWEILP